MEVTRGRKLRIPRFIRLRTDKPATACTADQLIVTQPYRGATMSMAGKAPAPEIILALRNYHEKRNFSVTNEPEGTPDMSGNRFVIQEHHSHKLHYDLRLERDGVLKSWAVPKGIPETAGAKHLAVAVEDHPLEYLSFEGEDPERRIRGRHGFPFGTGGTYDTKHWDMEKIEVILHGRRLNGACARKNFKRARGKNDWLLFRTA